MNKEEEIWEGGLEREEDTTRLARLLAPHLRGGDLLILSGGLGAGKTFFTRSLCYALGLPQDERVTSPTFTLVHEYETTPPLLHADLYRLSDEDEVFELGLEVERSRGRLLVVEWGAPFEGVLGGDALFLSLDIDPRRGRLHGRGERAQQIVHAFLRAGGDAP
jgi:tRNA threonylcarbamoyladenosine biosynthesis protein TsaE